MAAALVLALLAVPAANGARTRIPPRSQSPYLSALVINAETGEVVFDRNSQATAYPASLVKLMMLLVIQEKLEEGSLRLEDRVKATAEAAGTGGSQVYLAENEVFTIEDLLYSLIIQSANDSAVALAVHIAGSTEAFTRMMQARADQLGMTETEFHSVHGLPPSTGQKPDVTTARDLARLALELVRHPDIFRYTSTEYRTFRDGKFDMRSHNNLLGSFDGCDGLKTGFFRAGGYSIVATAQRRGTRFVAVVLGAKQKKERDAAARELLSRAFSSTVLPPPTPVATEPLPSPTPAPRPSAVPAGETNDSGKGCPLGSSLPLAAALVAVGGFFFWLGSRRRR